MIPKSHPRYNSLGDRHLLLEGIKRGIVTEAGLIAHGRGEAFDYLLGEKTTREGKAAVRAAVALMLLAEKPVISVNGNVAALVPNEAVKLANALNAKLEVNVFYRKMGREKAIADLLKKNGAGRVYGVTKVHKLPVTDSHRAKVGEAIWEADVIAVALEDGDRTEALKKMGKSVVAVDLNPLSRTAQKADITIVDNITRAFPLMIEAAGKLKGKNLEKIVKNFDNKKNLKAVETSIRSML